MLSLAMPGAALRLRRRSGLSNCFAQRSIQVDRGTRLTSQGGRRPGLGGDRVRFSLREGVLIVMYISDSLACCVLWRASQITSYEALPKKGSYAAVQMRRDIRRIACRG